MAQTYRKPIQLRKDLRKWSIERLINRIMKVNLINQKLKERLIHRKDEYDKLKNERITGKKELADLKEKLEERLTKKGWIIKKLHQDLQDSKVATETANGFIDLLRTQKEALEKTIARMKDERENIEKKYDESIKTTMQNSKLCIELMEKEHKEAIERRVKTLRELQASNEEKDEKIKKTEEKYQNVLKQLLIYRGMHKLELKKHNIEIEL